MKLLPRSISVTATIMVAAILLFSGCRKGSKSEDLTVSSTEYRIGMSLWVSHPVIFDLRDGFVDRLNSIAADKGFSIEFDEKNAEGQTPQLTQISGYMTRGRHDLVYSIGAPATLNLKAQKPQVPVLFAGVPDPVKSGFVKSLNDPEFGITGARFLPPANVIFEAFKIAYPEAKVVGVLRNPGEVNSTSTAEPVITYFRSKGIEVKDFSITEAPQLNVVLQKLSGAQLDALFVPTDNLVYQNLQRVVQECKSLSIPLISVTDVAVKMGADFSVGVPYYRIGEITADMAYEILSKGKSANEVPVRDINSGYLYISNRYESTFSNWQSDAFPTKLVE